MGWTDRDRQIARQLWKEAPTRKAGYEVVAAALPHRKRGAVESFLRRDMVTRYEEKVAGYPQAWPTSERAIVKAAVDSGDPPEVALARMMEALPHRQRDQIIRRANGWYGFMLHPDRVRQNPRREVALMESAVMSGSVASTLVPARMFNGLAYCGRCAEAGAVSLLLREYGEWWCLTCGTEARVEVGR